MEMHRDDFNLAAELSALRPSPRAAFTDELDACVAAGFPRAGRPGGNPIGRIAETLRAISPRRLALPTGAIALTALVVATAVIAIDQSAHDASPAMRFVDLGRSAGERASGGHPSNEFSDAPPTVSGKPSEGSLSSSASAPASGAGFQSASPLLPHSATRPFARSIAAKASRRDVERSAEMVLGSDPATVRNDAAKVFDAVHAADGIVLSSSIRDGAEGEAGAEFELLIPAAKLGDALASFSRIGQVLSRHEATQDITAPTVGVGERLNDSQARIDGLLAQLAQADTEGERSGVEAELRAERGHQARLRARLGELSRRAHLSRVSLRIETGPSSTGSGSAGGSWGVDNALDDAGHILKIAAGVIVIGLAVIGPLALIALLTWLTNRAWVRNRRQRALN